MRALVSFTLQRELRTNMRRTQLLSYSPQPSCLVWPACFIFTCFYSSQHISGLFLHLLQEVKTGTVHIIRL